MSQNHNPRRRLPKDIPLGVANQIDLLCDRFESVWISGARPTIDTFLSETAEAYRPYLFGELVRIDLEYRARHGEPARIDEYLSQYPTYSFVLSRIGDELAHEETITARATRREVAGRYQLVLEIGEGGFGVVWRAWDTQLTRFVALKLPKARLTGPDEVKAFLKEARAAAELDHTHIVPVLDMGTDADDTPFLVSRLVEGISLRHWIKQHPQSPRGVAGLMVSLCDAMDHARVKGVVHRDLKPSNVLVDANGMPHITDFGLALRADAGGTIEPSGTMAGTPAYMSPEQVRGRPRADHRADVYGLGVTLYDLLSGQRPFQGTQVEILNKILCEEPPALRALNPEIPVDLATICHKAMEKEREDRYPTAGAMADDLRRYRNDEPIGAKPLGKLERARRWAKKNRTLTAAICALVLAVGTSIALGVAMQTRVAASTEQGDRQVQITTKPEGARIVFWKLSDRTGEPTPEDESTRFEAPTPSPVMKRPIALPPGEYLVVAALADGRFHEVYRHVPNEDEKRSFGPEQRSWRKSRDDSNYLILPAIDIPDHTVTEGMALIEGTDSLHLPFATEGGKKGERRSVSGFHIDSTELTVGQYKKTSTSKVTQHQHFAPVPDDHALCLPFDLCVRIAESKGKRLPSAAEYEFAATDRSRSRFPWGEIALDLAQRDVAMTIGPVGAFAIDRLNTEPPVIGLCSNVAEWTMTYAFTDDLANRPLDPVDHKVPLQRVVKGALPETPLRDESLSPYEPRRSAHVSRYEINARIGMRCVRSIKARMTLSDF